MTYDAIVLAGDRGSSRNIYHKNKNFLTIKGVPLIVYILLTLENVRSVNKVYVIGPKERLLEIINAHAPHLRKGKIAKILEQKQTVYENFWHAYNNMFENYDKDSLYYRETSEYQEKSVLVMPGDIPLVTPHEIEYFLSHCDSKNYDYVAGLTPCEKLKFFYPSGDNPGVKMSYIHFKEGLYRSYNLHLIKPVKIGSAENIQKFYECRYQKEIKNILKFITEVLKIKNNYTVIWYYGLMQLALFFSSIHLNAISFFVRQFIPLNRVEKSVSSILKTRFKTIYVPYPGATLDIDNEKTYNAMDTMFDKWKRYLLTND